MDRRPECPAQDGQAGSHPEQRGAIERLSSGECHDVRAVPEVESHRIR